MIDSMCSDNTSYIVDSVINNLVIKIGILLNSFLITIPHDDGCSVMSEQNINRYDLYLSDVISECDVTVSCKYL